MDIQSFDLAGSISGLVYSVFLGLVLGIIISFLRTQVFSNASFINY